MQEVSDPSTSTALIVTPVPFFGHLALVPASDGRVQELRAQLQALHPKLEAIAKQKPRGEWRDLRDDVHKAVLFVTHSPAIPQYKLELLPRLIEYVDTIAERQKNSSYLLPAKPIDPARFQQLNQVLFALTRQETKEPPPAEILLELDKVLAQVRDGYYPSEFGKALRPAVQRQWQPIIVDNRRAMQALGSTLLFLSLMEIVYRPLLMLYPMYHLLAEVASLVQSIRTRSASLDTIAGLFKALVLLFIVWQVSALVSSYSFVGQACFGLGALTFLSSMSEGSVKQAAPAIAPVASQVYGLLFKLQASERAALDALSATLERTSPSTKPSAPARVADKPHSD